MRGEEDSLLKKHFIDRNDLQSINELGYVNEEELAKVMKYVRRIKKWQVDDYKYGSSHIDMWLLNRQINRLNAVLHKYRITVS
jgi:hypothetical protein